MSDEILLWIIMLPLISLMGLAILLITILQTVLYSTLKSDLPRKGNYWLSISLHQTVLWWVLGLIFTVTFLVLSFTPAPAPLKIFAAMAVSFAGLIPYSMARCITGIVFRPYGLTNQFLDWLKAPSR